MLYLLFFLSLKVMALNMSFIAGILSEYSENFVRVIKLYTGKILPQCGVDKVSKKKEKNERVSDNKLAANASVVSLLKFFKILSSS